MNDDNFFKYLDRARNWLEERQMILSIDGIGNGLTYEANQESQIIRFDNGNNIVCYKFIPIGSFNGGTQIFQWAWSNNNINRNLREKSKAFISLNEITGSTIFSDEIIEADETMAWDIAAMCGQMIDSVGIYAPENKSVKRFYALLKLS